MNRYTKAGLLIVTLVIPALIFTFLRFFATNHYSIPYYHPVTDAKGNVRIVNGDTLFYKVESFKAVNSQGIPVADGVFDQKLSVVTYFPEVCEDSCAIAQDNLQRVYELTKNIKSLQIVSICDTITERVKKSPAYIKNQGWSLAKVERKDLDKMLNEILKFQTQIPGMKTNSLKSKLMLVDNVGHVRGYYDGFDTEETDRLMAEIKILNFEENEEARN